MNKTATIKKLVTATLATAAFALCAPAAHATLILTLNDGTNPLVTITDNLSGDTAAATGSIGYFGGIGSWSALITTGGSNAPGTFAIAFLDFASIILTNAGAGSLTLTLTDDGFTNPVGTNAGASTGIGGTTTGAVSAYSLFNGNSLLNLGSFTGNPSAGNSFSGGGGASVNTTTPNPFSLTNSVTVTYGAGGGQSTFAMKTSVPEPATLGLLGLGLLGIGLARRKFARGQPTRV